MKGESCRSLMLVKFLMPLERSHKGIQKSPLDCRSLFVLLYLLVLHCILHSVSIGYMRVSCSMLKIL